MEFNEELRTISEDYNNLIEDLVPHSIPPSSLLMQKRVSGERFYLKVGRLGMAYLLLIFVFASASMFLINTFKTDEIPRRDQLLNAAVFSVESPGSIVTAFREAVR